MLHKIKKWFRKRKWRKSGALMLEYPGYTCGCCGAGIKDRFFLPAYRSVDAWQDTVGICPKCRTKNKNLTQQEIVGWE